MQLRSSHQKFRLGISQNIYGSAILSPSKQPAISGILFRSMQKRGELFSVEVKADEAHYGCRRKGKRERARYRKISAFGFLKRKGVISVEVTHNVYIKTLPGLTAKKVKRESIFCIDKQKKDYNSSMLYEHGYLSVDHKKYLSFHKVCIGGVLGFRSSAKEHLIKHHCVSKNYLPLYLKEMESRYNNNKCQKKGRNTN